MDGLAGGRLRDVLRIGGFGKAASLGDFTEHFHVAQMHDDTASGAGIIRNRDNESDCLFGNRILVY